jgi:hypothetical protein
MLQRGPRGRVRRQTQPLQHWPDLLLCQVLLLLLLLLLLV